VSARRSLPGARHLGQSQAELTGLLSSTRFDKLVDTNYSTRP